MILLFLLGFSYIIDEHSCLKYCILIKLSQIVCLINVHILVCCYCHMWMQASETRKLYPVGTKLDRNTGVLYTSNSVTKDLWGSQRIEVAFLVKLHSIFFGIKLLLELTQNCHKFLWALKLNFRNITPLFTTGLTVTHIKIHQTYKFLQVSLAKMLFIVQFILIYIFITPSLLPAKYFFLAFLWKCFWNWVVILAPRKSRFTNHVPSSSSSSI